MTRVNLNVRFKKGYLLKNEFRFLFLENEF